jgi:hypothetical protein
MFTHQADRPRQVRQKAAHINTDLVAQIQPNIHHEAGITNARLVASKCYRCDASN